MNKRDVFEYCLAQKLNGAIEQTLKESANYRLDELEKRPTGDLPGTELAWAIAADFTRQMEKLGVIRFDDVKAMTKAQYLNLFPDATVPEGIVIFQDQHGKEVGRIENLRTERDNEVSSTKGNINGNSQD